MADHYTHYTNGEESRTLIPAPTGVVEVSKIPLAARWSGPAVKIAPMLRRHRLAVAVTILLCISAAALVSCLETPLFRATTVLEVRGYNRDFLNLKDLDPMSSLRSGDALVSTEMKLIRTQTLAASVVKHTNLINNQEFFQRSPLNTALRQLLKVPERPLPAGETETVQKLLDRIGVKLDGDSDLITVTVDTPDPRLSARLANQISTDYIQLEQEERWNSAVRVGNWLTGQLEDLRLKLQQSENELQRYANTAGLLFTDDRNNVADDQLRQIQQDYSRAQADRGEKQAQMEAISSVSPDSLPHVLDDSAARELGTRLADLHRQYAELTTTLLPTHYRVQRVRDQIAEIESELAHQQTVVLARIRAEYQTAARKEKLLQQAYESQARIVSDQNSRAVRYNVLRREVETNRVLYSSMLEKFKEASVLSALRADSVRVVDPAQASQRQYHPDLVMNSALGLIAALLCSLLVVMARERVDASIREPGEISHLRIRELGVIPAARAFPRLKSAFRHNSPLISPSSMVQDVAVDQRLVTLTNSRSPLAEAYRSVAFSIIRRRPDSAGRAKVIVLTSAHEKAGKSLAAANLAISLAKDGLETLLMDGDLRRPHLHRLFGLSPSPGLGDVLARQGPIAADDLTEAARPIAIPRLRIVTAGVVQDPTIIGSARTRDFVTNLRTKYDIILIDTPPLALLPDARVISQLADAVVLVCRAGQTSVHHISDSVQLLEEDGATVLGAILNDWDPKIVNPRYFNSHYSTYFQE